jgi:hypothetical protein
MVVPKGTLNVNTAVDQVSAPENGNANAAGFGYG